MGQGSVVGGEQGEDVERGRVVLVAGKGVVKSCVGLVDVRKKRGKG